MSMSSNVVGFKPPDAKWKKMFAIYEACQDGNIEIPEEVDEFFEGENPDPEGVRVDLDEHDCCKEYNDETSCSGYEIDVSKLPKDIKTIRFTNCW